MSIPTDKDSWEPTIGTGCNVNGKTMFLNIPSVDNSPVVSNSSANSTPVAVAPISAPPEAGSETEPEPQAPPTPAPVPNPDSDTDTAANETVKNEKRKLIAKRKKVEKEDQITNSKHSENDTLSVPAVENQKPPKDEVVNDVVVPIPRPAEPKKEPCEHDPTSLEKAEREENAILPYPSQYQNRFDESKKKEASPNPRPPKYGNNYETPSVGIPNSI